MRINGVKLVNGAHVSLVALDSSIGILGRVQLEGASSPADNALGLDTNLMATARKTGLLATHGFDMTGRTALPVDFKHDVFVPFDWGYFLFVYNSETLSDVPTSMQALIDAPNDLRIIIQDPRTATPDLGLLLWVKSVYGDDAPAAWAKLEPKIITVTKGWWDSQSMFQEGEADMVLSYSTSPAHHIIVEATEKYRAATFFEGHYMQVEVAAMLKNAPQPELAAKFMDFILAEGFQSVIPTTNWMYPAGNAAVPAAFEGLISPAKSLLFTPEEVEAGKSGWVAEWQTALSQQKSCGAKLTYLAKNWNNPGGASIAGFAIAVGLFGLAFAALGALCGARGTSVLLVSHDNRDADYLDCKVMRLE